MILVTLTAGSPAKVLLVNRVAAKGIDLLVFVALAVILPYPLGSLAGFAYSLVGDAFSFGPFQSQSVGKKIMKLQTRNVKTGGACTFREAALRNAPVGVATFFSLIPVWGWLLLALIGIPLMLIEIYLMATVPAGHRLGDVMGDTEVVSQR